MNKKDKQILSLRTAYIAGIFSLIICTVMIMNYWQLVTTDPLESEALKVLVEKLKDDSSNEELRQEIRNLDLMARSAYFTNQWQIRSGAYLLIGSIILMVIALRVYYSLKAEIIEPEAKETSLDIELFISRKWITSTLLIIFGLALAAAFLSDDHLSDYDVLQESLSQTQVPSKQITPVQDTLITEAVEEKINDTEYRDSISAAVITKEQDQPVEQINNAEHTTAPESTAKVVDAMPKPPGNEDINRNFPAFRGPFGLGISNHKNIPTDWDGASGKNILWKTSVPLDGYSSPVLWGNSIFITGADENNQSVYCFNAETGKMTWEHKVVGITRPPGKIDPTDDTGFAASTAATDGRYVFAIFATGDLVCTDLAGNRIWAKNMGLPDNHYGHSSSLIVWKDLVFVQFDTNEEGQVSALNVHTGDQVWKTARKSKISWASPILTEMGDHYELVLASSPFVSAYHSDTGEELWSVDCMSGEVGASPAFSNGVVFAANEYARLVALKPGNPGTILWETNEYLPEVSSPVAVNDLLFVGTSYAVIVCYSAVTGEILWEQDADRGFYASPIVVDDKVYFLDRGGKMYIFSSDNKANLINKPELGENTVSTPAFSEGRIYIRGIDNLYCIGH